jgi:hypothetical protein
MNVNSEAVLTYERIRADPSQDMWSLGCVLYHLFSGEPLFISNDEDNLTDQDTMLVLIEWKRNASYKESRLSRITNVFARNLVSQLLSANPLLRPKTATHVLSHSFFTGKQVRRMAGQEAEFDVFISYRVDSDAVIARKMYDMLTGKGFAVWLDVHKLKDGVSWEEGFCNGLVNSRAFLPIISSAAIKARFENLTEISKCDNVLLEHRLATELQARGMIEYIYPLFVGDLDTVTQQYGNYFHQGCAPSPASSACVSAVEEKLKIHLDNQGLGLPYKTSPSVREVLASISICQGGRVEGNDLDVILDSIAVRVSKMVQEIDTRGEIGSVGGGGGGGGVGGVSGHEAMRELAEKDRIIQELKERISELENRSMCCFRL